MDYNDNISRQPNLRNAKTVQSYRSISAVRTNNREDKEAQSKMSSKSFRPLSNISAYHTSRNNLKLYKRSEAIVRNDEHLSQIRLVSERKRLQSAKYLQGGSPTNVASLNNDLTYQNSSNSKQFELTKPAFTIKIEEL